ncbi:hypothetical protein Lepto7376_1473 [[Leptolyngbya] sp. PCC 7376]|nr:hypothetical protein Lepto7376_1473 [[Leptolyngbya] sp. PCC 7376]
MILTKSQLAWDFPRIAGGEISKMVLLMWEKAGKIFTASPVVTLLKRFWMVRS